MFIPGLASAQSAKAQGSTTGAIQGTVKDGSGSAVTETMFSKMARSMRSGIRVASKARTD
jgi:hypothetical protein